MLMASRDDPYLKALAKDGRHCHGYGYVAAVNTGKGWKLAYERFDAEPPLSGEEACAANLSMLEYAVSSLRAFTAGQEESLVILHSRRTRNEPRGVHGAHPFREEALVETEKGYERAEFYLCHNGGVDKQELSSMLNLQNPHLFTDSHLLLKYIVKRIERTSFEEIPEKMAAVISETRPLSKSALNLGMLVFTQTAEPVLVAVGCVNESDEDRWRYYEPVMVYSDDLAGYVSGTIRDILSRSNFDGSFVDGKNNFLSVVDPHRQEEYPV